MRFIVYIVLLGLITSGCNDNKNDSSNLNKGFNTKYEYFHTFKDQQTNVLGKLYVHYLNAHLNIIDSLLIVNDENGTTDTLYHIAGTDLCNKKGTELEVSKEKFNGYKIVLTKDDYLVLVLSDSIGNGKSDNLTIHWNYANKLFEWLKTP